MSEKRLHFTFIYEIRHLPPRLQEKLSASDLVKKLTADWSEFKFASLIYGFFIVNPGILVRW